MSLDSIDLRSNSLKVFPSVLYKLTSLQNIDIARNREVKEISSEVLKLVNLVELDCEDCTSLTHPPYSVCQQGLSAIQKYFIDLQKDSGVKFVEVPVAVLGCTLAGKTSLVKSLQQNKRYLTERVVSSLTDEATKVFNVEDLDLGKTNVKFIDYGGHEVYHLVYQLAQKDRCIPLLVVNLKEFHDLSITNGPREATRRVLFDWLSHLYLACPDLGSPLLVLTHLDQVEGSLQEDKKTLLDTAESIRDQLFED